jgi:hypothetical protein
VIGSITLQTIDNVFWSWKGSISAVVGSGSRTMSDSAISWKPRIEEPSKSKSLREGLFVEGVYRQAQVLPGAGQVGELEVHHPDPVLLGEREDILRLGDPAADERSTVSGVT